MKKLIILLLLINTPVYAMMMAPHKYIDKQQKDNKSTKPVK